MDFTKILAAGFVVLLTAGAVAAGGTGSTGPTAQSMDTPRSHMVTNADVDAALDNETVTLTLVDTDTDTDTGAGDGDGVANATVNIERTYERDDESRSEYVGMTDANGTITFDLTPADESRTVTGVDVQLAKGSFSAELEYRVEDGSLVLTEEEYEYESEYTDGDDRADARDDDSETAQDTDDERPRVSMAEARATADAALEEPPQGSWRLVEADAPDEDDHYYEFEYVLVDAESEGDAEIRVHAERGDVIEYEVEIEGLDRDDDERDDGVEDDDREDRDDDERDDGVEDDDREDRDDDERDDDDDEDDEDDDEDDDDEDEHEDD